MRPMNRTRLIWAACAVGAAAAAAIAVDVHFKYAVSAPAPASGMRSVAIATEGALTGRRAAYLTCSPNGKARVLMRARFLEIERSKVAATSNGHVHLGYNNRKTEIAFQIPMTLTSDGWVDTLESADLPANELPSLRKGLQNPDLEFLGVFGFEHGIYFHKRIAPLDLSAVDACLSK